jgi:hypothetical protein
VVWYAARKGRLPGGIPVREAQHQTIGTGLGGAGILRAGPHVQLQADKNWGSYFKNMMQQWGHFNIGLRL